jgi:hypothetical protein
LSHALVPLL